MSKTIIKVGLNGVKFNAAIGLYPEERLLKNDFLVDIDVQYLTIHSLIKHDLKDGVDYSRLFNICKAVFGEETLYLENVAQEILDQILNNFSFIDECTVCIKKLNPPLNAQIHHSFVQLHYIKAES